MTMWFSVPEHFRVIIYSAIMGVVMGIIYDFVKLSRAMLGISKYSATAKKLSAVRLPGIKYRSRHKGKMKAAAEYVLLFIGDIIFSLICAAVYSLFLFHAIRGQLRWYFLLSSAIGFFLYYFTLSRFNLLVIETVFFGFRVVFLYLFEVLLIPFRLFKKFIIIIKAKVISPVFYSMKYKQMYKQTEDVMRDIRAGITFPDISQQINRR